MITFEFLSFATGDVLTLDQAKDHLRVAGSGEDEIIQTMINAAEGYIGTYTGRLLRQRTVKQLWDNWPEDGGAVQPYFGNVSEIASVRVRDEAGVMTDFTEYDADIISTRARIVAKTGVTLPRVYGPVNGLEVVYTAGYLPGLVPPDLIAAMKLLVADLYERRESSVKQLPSTIEWLLSMHRIWQI